MPELIVVDRIAQLLEHRQIADLDQTDEVGRAQTLADRTRGVSRRRPRAVAVRGGASSRFRTLKLAMVNCS